MFNDPETAPETAKTAGAGEVRRQGAPGALAAAAHLWVLDTGAFEQPGTARPWLARLEPGERDRYAAYRSSAARRDYLGTRALARTALAHYSGRPVADLHFAADRLGRPEMTSPSIPGLFFSFARTHRLAVALFARECNVGVDVESVRASGIDEVAEQFFSPEEQAELAALAAPEDTRRQARFCELWILREAYLKARGVGLRLPLEQLSFRPDGSGGARASFGPAIRDDPAHWQFGIVWLSDRQVVATCLRRPAAAAPTEVTVVEASVLVDRATQAPLD